MSFIALVGNPNVGKSTLFNALTGLKQHTGNWPGKTVELAMGRYYYRGKEYELVDLPGTYSLEGTSAEEAVTGDFIQSGSAEGTVVVCDATCLERSLILALQVICSTPKVLIAVNLMDEAQKMGLNVDIDKLSTHLGVPVIGICGKEKESIEKLRETLRLLKDGFLPYRPPVPTGDNWEISYAEELSKLASGRDNPGPTLTDKLDRILLHSPWAYPCLAALLFLILWLTIKAANYPSMALQWVFDLLGEGISYLTENFPMWLSGLIVEGLFIPVTRVVSVMLPPMAIFFPLFTLLEDVGYLPRVAYLLDEGFRRCGSCGKQALTMSMGFGCNAVGVTGCRIMDSPGERRMGILTNAFIPCNGRFPALLILMGLILGEFSPVLQAAGVGVLICLSVFMTLLATRFLHKRVLRGEKAVFVMEMPPYRRPKAGQVIVRSFIDRCFSILGRAIAVAAPMGLFLWGLQKIHVGEGNLLIYLTDLMEGPGSLLGIGGPMLLAFLLGSPANELVIPLGLMILTGGSLGAVETEETGQLLLSYGFTLKQCLCTMVFMLFHWPCTTTLWTVYRETKSFCDTVLAWLLPTTVGVVLCISLNLILCL